MSWLLAGCYGLVLINISGALQIRQTPRFIGARAKQDVRMSCLTSAGAVQWYRLNRYDQDRNEAAEVKTGGKIDISTPGSSLLIFDVRVEDKGVYFCKMNDTWGPGTELQVVRPLSQAQAQQRRQVKDALIILQALLLLVCTAALMLRRRALEEKGNSIYEEPEEQHIYAGLKVGEEDLYQELDFAQPERAEAPWE